MRQENPNKKTQYIRDSMPATLYGVRCGIKINTKIPTTLKKHNNLDKIKNKFYVYCTKPSQVKGIM